MAKVVLAYTGSLATTLCIHWLRTSRNLEVVTYSANLGQGIDLEPTGQHAIETGAGAAHILDLRDRLIDRFVFPALRAGAVYESGYLLANALTRPLIAEELVRVAREEGCEYVAHGCTGRGNDQHRLEAAIASLAPRLKIVAPLLEWGYKSEEELSRFAKSFGIRSVRPVSDEYSEDVCLWGRGVIGKSLEDPWEAPPESAFRWTRAPEKAPARGVEIEIEFERGLPVALDGERYESWRLVEHLNDLGGAHGVGRADLVENRVIGIKSREVYEAPAATILTMAHQALEDLTLSKDLVHYKRQVAERFADCIYDGMWFSRLRMALDAFCRSSQERVYGTVRVKLYRGSATVTGRKSEYSLYDASLARRRMFDASADPAARGFFDIWKLPRQREALQKRPRSG